MSASNFRNYCSLPIVILSEEDYGYTEEGKKAYIEEMKSIEDDEDYDIDDEDYLEYCCDVLRDDIEYYYQPMIDEFNEMIRDKQYHLANSNRQCDLDQADLLCGLEVVIESGYYTGVQLCINYSERYFDELNKTNQNLFFKFFKEMTKKGWKRLSCNGVFSNGEAIYSYVK